MPCCPASRNEHYPTLTFFDDPQPNGFVAGIRYPRQAQLGLRLLF